MCFHFHFTNSATGFILPSFFLSFFLSFCIDSIHIGYAEIKQGVMGITTFPVFFFVKVRVSCSLCQILLGVLVFLYRAFLSPILYACIVLYCTSEGECWFPVFILGRTLDHILTTRDPSRPHYSLQYTTDKYINLVQALTDYIYPSRTHCSLLGTIDPSVPGRQQPMLGPIKTTDPPATPASLTITLSITRIITRRYNHL